MTCRPLLLLVALAGLTGCNKPPAEEPPTLSESTLIGAWTPSDAACGGERGISFDAGGAFSSSNGLGTWRLEGDRLSLATFARAHPLEPGIALMPPGQTEQRLVLHAPDHISATWSDGSVHDFIRCS